MGIRSRRAGLLSKNMKGQTMGQTHSFFSSKFTDWYNVAVADVMAVNEALLPHVVVFLE